MVSRRILRIKALLALYAYNRRGDGDIVKAEKELLFSIGKTYDLYHYLLLLILEISDIAHEKIEFALQKKMPSFEDLNPRKRFIDNVVIEKLRENKQLRKYLDESKITWSNYKDIPRSLYSNMLTMPEYEAYINGEDKGFNSDRSFVIAMVRNLFMVNEDLASNLEEQSIYWNDDLSFVGAMIEKTIKKISPASGPDQPLMPLFSNKEDETFVKDLIRKAIINFDTTAELVDKNTTNWEIERIALMDRLVMQLAISEIMAFEEIPVKVSLNEYIDISKYYCTSKSNTFVNGILDKVVKVLSEESLMKKVGRGLIDESISQSAENAKKVKK